MIDTGSIPLSLYIHWPWCVKKCPYCDFNSHVLKGESLESAYLARLLEDMARQVPWAQSRPLHTIFVGGGTPNLMRPQTMEALLSQAEKLFGFEPNIEITMEANPGASEAKALRDFRAAGVNRLSLGVQSFHDAHLKVLGRIHSAQEAIHTLEEASRVFDNFNLDLMFGLPHQTLDELAAEFKRAVEAGSTHLSYYQLTLEEGTTFYKREPEGLPDVDLLSEMSDFVESSAAKAGFTHYEVSGYAKDPYFCRHNLNYWHYGDYLAIGAGAHGKVSNVEGVYRWSGKTAPKAYIDQPLSEPELVPLADRPFEYMLNQLRLYTPVDLTDFVAHTGVPLETIEPTLQTLEAQKLIERQAQTLTLTDRGQHFLSDVQEAFLAD